jgi:eukaryotic-like serine/threonine-protein kinase
MRHKASSRWTGKWVAYRSDESGRSEVYVRDFAPDRVPATGSGKWQISAAGGSMPRWRPDGKELYYVAPNRKLMAVAVKAAPPVFEPGTPVPLFDMPNVVGFFPFDVAPDGRFLINAAVDSPMLTASPITVVVNWLEAIAKK